MQCSDGRTFTEWKQDMPPLVKDVKDCFREANELRERLAEADAVIAYFQFDEGSVIDGGVFRANINRWADEALERYRNRQQERKDNSQFGVGA
jgi:hypothetical protein